MTRPDEDGPVGRHVPGFLTEWRELNGEDFTPVSYLNQPDGVPFTIAAQWLFSPEFVEYRGGVFWTEHTGELPEPDRETVDKWYTVFEGDVARTEAKANLTTLYDIFAACDLQPYEEDLGQLANSVARCWRALLHAEFPEREFVVDVYDDEQSYGPHITFFRRHADPAR